MRNFNISYRSTEILSFTTLLSFCLKETALPIESAFTIKASEDKTDPVIIQLKNESYGTDECEWRFEGSILRMSNQRTEGKVVFTQFGEYKMME